MSIPTRLSDYLDQRSVQYEVCTHGHSRTSAETSRLAHIPSSQLAKSVIVEDDFPKHSPITAALSIA